MLVVPSVPGVPNVPEEDPEADPTPDPEPAPLGEPLVMPDDEAPVLPEAPELLVVPLDGMVVLEDDGLAVP